VQADGRGLSPRPRGFSPESVVRPLAFPRQVPRPPLTLAVGRFAEQAKQGLPLSRICFCREVFFSGGFGRLFLVQFGSGFEYIGF